MCCSILAKSSADCFWNGVWQFIVLFQAFLPLNGWQCHASSPVDMSDMMASVSGGMDGPTVIKSSHVNGADFEAEMVGDMSEKLPALVAEHNAWLHSNCQRQVCAHHTLRPPTHPLCRRPILAQVSC